MNSARVKGGMVLRGRGGGAPLVHYVPQALNNHTTPLLTAFKKLPQQVKENYGECIKSLQRRFDPDSKSNCTWPSSILERGVGTKTGQLSVMH